MKPMKPKTEPVLQARCQEGHVVWSGAPEDWPRNRTSQCEACDDPFEVEITAYLRKGGKVTIVEVVSRNEVPQDQWRGQDNSRAVTLWEAMAGAPYALRVEVGSYSTSLSLKGAQHLQRRLAMVIERLKRKKTVKKAKKT
jgi:hypothetical protein